MPGLETLLDLLLFGSLFFGRFNLICQLILRTGREVLDVVVEIVR